MYLGETKFNPKLFESSQIVGYIKVDDASFNLLYTQVKVVMNKMFDIIPIRRFVQRVESVVLMDCEDGCTVEAENALSACWT